VSSGADPREHHRDVIFSAALIGDLDQSLTRISQVRRLLNDKAEGPAVQMWQVSESAGPPPRPRLDLILLILIGAVTVASERPLRGGRL
jgi:hypothetical protein